MLDFVRSFKALDRRIDRAVIAIPANNEADRIAVCLSALALQRDFCGEPIPSGAFEIIVFANNCIDDTAIIAREMATVSPHPIVVVEETLPPEKSNAGWARKHAMDLAADRLAQYGVEDGIILTTDADSCVSPTWFAATLAAFEKGVDCVAGYVDAHPAEMLRLGSAFVSRGRLEDRYLRKIAEIYALCDPQQHDPWPNHRVSSGASLAVSLSAYLAIGGLPPKPVGEDAALTRMLEAAGYRIRHAMEVCVSTSCRFDGRARGGAADTMQYRHAVADAPCDDDIEPALTVARRAMIQGRLRRSKCASLLSDGRWKRRLGLTGEQARDLLSTHKASDFSVLWTVLQAASPALSKRSPLRPRDLPREIERAEAILRHLRDRFSARRKSAPADMSGHARSGVAEIA